MLCCNIVIITQVKTTIPMLSFYNHSFSLMYVEVGTGMEMLLTDMRRRELDEEGRELLQAGGDVWINQGLLFYKGKIYILVDFRHQVIESHHMVTDVGHPGQSKTIKLIMQNYWWPSLTVDVKQFVQQCLQCQQMKTFLTKPSGLLIPNPIPSGPWQEISVDLIVGLPDSQGYNSILVIVDWFTKMIHALLTMSTITAKGIAKLYHDNVWKLHGLPKKVISDKGP